MSGDATFPRDLSNDTTMALFADRRVENFGAKLPLQCFVAGFPREMVEMLDQTSRSSCEDRITSIESAFRHPSIDLETLFKKGRETEEPPPPADLDAIVAFVAECKADIEVLNTEIPETLRTVINLCRELTEATCRLVHKTEQVNLAEYIVSPPRHLPDDVLQEILIFCWESCDSFDPNPHLVPIRLAAVCHRWRSVVFSTPKLWSRIRTLMWKEDSVNFAKSCMERTHTVSLTLRGGRYSDVQPFFSFLSTASIRISHLAVEPVQEVLMKDLHSVLMRHAVNAEELVLFTHTLDDLDAPRLKRLYLRSLPRTWQWTFRSDDSMPLRFSQFANLTVLHFQEPMRWDAIDLILEQSRELCSLSVCIEDRSHRSRPLPVAQANCHNHLQYLAISHSSIHGLPETFLHQWTFPRLRSLGYGFGHAEFPRSSKWLVSHPSISRLTRLLFAYSVGTNFGDTLSAILEAGNSLEQVILVDAGLSHGAMILGRSLEILASIAIDAKSQSFTTFPPVLARLREIHVVWDGLSGHYVKKYEEDIQRLYQAFAFDRSWSNAHSIARLRLVLKYQVLCFTEKDSEKAKELLSSIRETGATIENALLPHVEVRRELNNFGSSRGGFETWPLPFDQSPYFEVLKEDGSWEGKCD